MMKNITCMRKDLNHFRSKTKNLFLNFGAALIVLTAVSSVSARSSGAYVRRTEPLNTPATGNFTFGFTLGEDMSGTGVTSLVGLAFGSDSAPKS
jgi:hypothetical protein